MTNAIQFDPREFEVVLFDVIGTTIIESEEGIINNCFEDAFSFFRLPVTSAFIHASRGKSKREVIADVLTKYRRSTEQGEAVYLRFRENVMAEIDHFTPAPGATELFSHLWSRGIKVALGSGLPADLLNPILTSVGWSARSFQYIGTADDVITGRPDPAMINEMMKQLHISDSRKVLKVGDTVSDIREGKNADVFTAAILSGTQSEEILRAEHPDFILNQLIDLKQLL
jgi:phosphonatase-like hydrolase